MTIGERIKQARKANRLSMRTLADKVDLSAMAISKYERGLITPGSGVLVRLAQALDVSTDFLLRPATVSVELQAYRKHATLGIKEREAIEARVEEWLERYLAIESFFPDQRRPVSLPSYPIHSLDEVEDAAVGLRMAWSLGFDPIENLTQLLEDRGIKVGLVAGFERFDACTFVADGIPVIATKAGLPGDRQRFNLGHELGHLILDVEEGVDVEAACHRFVGAFLAPAEAVRFELGTSRTALDMNELYLLKHKYGLSMQAWVFRARDLGIISVNEAKRLFRDFSARGWRRCEPGDALPPEQPMRMERLVYRALAEDLISRSRAQELLGEPLHPVWTTESLERNDVPAGPGH